MISPVIWGTHTEPQSLFLSALAEIKDQKQYLLAANNVKRLSMLPSPPCTPSPPAKRLQGGVGDMPGGDGQGTRNSRDMGVVFISIVSENNREPCQADTTF